MRYVIANECSVRLFVQSNLHPLTTITITAKLGIATAPTTFSVASKSFLCCEHCTCVKTHVWCYPPLASCPAELQHH